MKLLLWLLRQIAVSGKSVYYDWLIDGHGVTPQRHTKEMICGLLVVQYKIDDIDETTKAELHLFGKWLQLFYHRRMREGINLQDVFGF